MSLADKLKRNDESQKLIQWLKQKEKEKIEPTQLSHEPSQSHTLVDVGVGDGGAERASQPVTIAYGFPACPHCESSWITEHPDAQSGGVYLRCWSCRSNIPKQILDNRIRINAATSTEQRRLLPW